MPDAVPSLEAASSALPMPKSASLTAPVRATSTLVVLTSRCRIGGRSPCAAPSARHDLVRDEGAEPRRRRSRAAPSPSCSVRRSQPSTSSMTMACSPPASTTSSTCAMLACVSRAASRASVKSDARRRSSASRSGNSRLSATVRAKPCAPRCTARQTSALPPRPSRAPSSNGPNRRIVSSIVRLQWPGASSSLFVTLAAACGGARDAVAGGARAQPLRRRRGGVRARPLARGAARVPARLRALAATGVLDQLRAGLPQARRLRRRGARVPALPGDRAAVGAGGAGAASARADQGGAGEDSAAATGGAARSRRLRQRSRRARPRSSPRRRRHHARSRARGSRPVVVAGVLVVGGAVAIGVVFGTPARDTFKPTPLGTVDFR